MIRKILIIGLFSLIAFGCTKLHEDFHDALTEIPTSGGSANLDALLRGVYNTLQTTFQDQANAFAMEEMTTDEMVGPTRGPDWDDNGAWRVLHAHKWDGDNVHVRDLFNQLSGTSYAATDYLRLDSTSANAAQARYLRAFAQYMLLDGYDQVPYRAPGESTLLPSNVRKGTEELDYIISELNAVLSTLPAGPPGKANKDAAKVLLMKCYLNKGVYANRAAPTFDAGDMQKVITLAKEIAPTVAGVPTGGNYSFSANYFDNFAPNNTSIGKENIWVQQNDAGVSGSFGSTVRSRWHTVMHYNQNPGGWNGFTTLSDFYNKFENGDIRKGMAYPTPGAPNPGNRVNVGFYIGQQYNWANDAMLSDRTGSPLVFTPEVSLIETGDNLEVTGIRPNKFPIDYPNDNSGNVDNDYPYFRLSDVLLMEAEAEMRSGGAANALLLVNAIRANRGATPFASVTLDNLLDERGRELYLEGWRRQDMIRFGKFLAPFQLKPEASDPKYLLFAIPNEQLAVNPNLTPNPGY
ncbi:MAG: RagB/SusD family nutrient uptake outer membrane protein [Bacteroidota bacterium]|nr:RagB/SusD family nutrient uptake outer membrane protein [Bacteroidota bacterium]